MRDLNHCWSPWWSSQYSQEGWRGKHVTSVFTFVKLSSLIFFMQLCSFSLLSATPDILPSSDTMQREFCSRLDVPTHEDGSTPLAAATTSLFPLFSCYISSLTAPVQSWGNAAERSWTRGSELGEDQHLKVLQSCLQNPRCDLQGCSSGPHAAGTVQTEVAHPHSKWIFFTHAVRSSPESCHDWIMSRHFWKSGNWHKSNAHQGCEKWNTICNYSTELELV